MECTANNNISTRICIPPSITTTLPASNGVTPTTSQKVERLGREVIEMLKGAMEQAKKAKGKDIIALIGNTGAGKSTAVNQYLGKHLQLVHQGRSCIIQVAEGEVEIAKIGHRAGTSETRYTRIYEENGCPFIFADCGGFFDTRGVATDIAVVTSSKLTFENANSVKLILCFDASAIKTDRAIHFTQSINLVLGTLLKDYKKHSDSILIMFTKPTMGLDGKLFSASDARLTLVAIMEDLSGPQKELYKFILRDHGKYVCVCNPLSNESRDENLAIMQQMKKIENTQEVFQAAYSTNSQLKLLEEMTAIAIIGSELYNAYSFTCETIQRYKEEMANLQKKIENIQASIQSIGSGNGDPAVIQAAEEAIISENRTLIRQQQSIIQELKEKMQQSKAKIEAAQEKIAHADKKGEEEMEYWFDQINQEGINIESRTTTTSTTSKSGFLGFGGGSHQESSTTVTVDKRTIPRDFYYRGPEISQVVKDPQEGPCWSNEKKTADSYSIHYESGKGEAAIASVKIFVHKKHLPTEIIERVAFVNDINRDTTELSTYAAEIGKIEKVIHQAETAIAAEGNVLEKLEQFKQSVGELKNSKEDYDQKLKSALSESENLKKRIQDNTEDFTFLKDYLELSHDDNLKNKEIISKFLNLDKKYLGMV